MTKATVITDASFCSRTKKAGWAAWVRVDGVSDPIKMYGSFKKKVGSSTDAEQLASINGIWIAKQHGATDILLQTDCLLVVHIVNGYTKKRPILDQWGRWCASCGVLGAKIRAKHVKGHTKTADARSYVNRWCDEKANKARRATA